MCKYCVVYMWCVIFNLLSAENFVRCGKQGDKQGVTNKVRNKKCEKQGVNCDKKDVTNKAMHLYSDTPETWLPPDASRCQVLCLHRHEHPAGPPSVEGHAHGCHERQCNVPVDAGRPAEAA